MANSALHFQSFFQPGEDALDRLVKDGEVDISVQSVGYRSAFIGAVLKQVPSAQVKLNPQRVALVT